MLKTIKLSKNVIKICSDCNVYLIENKILIDTAENNQKKELLETIKGITSPESIKKVIFTHLHYDHVGNWDLFPNAKFYSAEVFDEFKKDKALFIIDLKTADKFKAELNDVEKDEQLKEIFTITKTPGHDKSCIILYYNKDNVLFTGDTYFYDGCYGRVDLPKSEPEKMEESIKKVNGLIKKYKPIIAPGHGY